MSALCAAQAASTEGGAVKLTTLEAHFVRTDDGGRTITTVDSIGDAHGVMFLCPKCFIENKGPIGTHSVLCWCPSVPLEIPPGPGRWAFAGTGIDDLTLVAGSSSILLKSGCAWHGFVRNGDAT